MPGPRPGPIGPEPLAADRRGPRPTSPPAVAYLTNSANLVDGDHYEPFGPGFADIGLTIDGALALAAAGTTPLALADMVQYVATTDPRGPATGRPRPRETRSGKEALLAEAVGENPRAFGGEDLIGALDATGCSAPSPGVGGPCVAAGNFAYSSSTYGRPSGSWLSSGRTTGSGAARPIQYLQSLQDADGGWPSLIPRVLRRL